MYRPIQQQPPNYATGTVPSTSTPSNVSITSAYDIARGVRRLRPTASTAAADQRRFSRSVDHLDVIGEEYPVPPRNPPSSPYLSHKSCNSPEAVYRRRLTSRPSVLASPMTFRVPVAARSQSNAAILAPSGPVPPRRGPASGLYHSASRTSIHHAPHRPLGPYFYFCDRLQPRVKKGDRIKPLGTVNNGCKNVDQISGM
uniref:SH3 domain-containing protein n=1 Tax=Panagrellus redivivus TaxID=6233 RepID=A0A7E4WAQ0_PANRE